MTYPHFVNKHLHAALISPESYIRYKKWKKGTFPKKYIVVYQLSALQYFIRKYKPKKQKLYSLLNIYRHKDIGFVRMTGIGAPNAVTVLEELIALGGRTFLNIGTAGGLHKEGVFVCTGAIRDEGTSYHYLSHGKEVFPDKRLTARLGKSMQKQGLEVSRCTTWTIDAPYRETKTEVAHYAKQGVSTVEMEASALFAVACVRKVKIASAFVVSDLLGKTWTPNFHRLDVKNAQRRLIDAAVECLL